MGIRNMVIGLVLGLLVLFSIPDQVERNHNFALRPSDSTVELSQPSALAAGVEGAIVPVGRPAASAVGSEEESASENTIPDASLKELLSESIAKARVRLPSNEELAAFEELFARMMRLETADEIDAAVIGAWRRLGWKLSLCEDHLHTLNRNLLVISECEDQRYGRGIYAIRLGCESNVVLEAPHRFFDEGSGLIARKLFLEHDVRAVAWNTIHRREVDLAHVQSHFINAFTESVVSVDSNMLVAQLHGFADEKQTARAAKADMIVSDGTRFPARVQVAIAAELKQAFHGKSVFLFPDEVDSLGGTQNRQARVMRNAGATGFLHLEMNSETRLELMRNASKRSDFFRSLTGPTKNLLQTVGR